MQDKQVAVIVVIVVIVVTVAKASVSMTDVKRRASPKDVMLIDLTEEDDDDDDKKKPSSSSSLESVRKRIKTETSMPAAASISAEVQVMDAPPPTIITTVAAVAAAAPSQDDDDDVELVGTAHEQRLPHMRQHCTQHPLSAAATSATSSITQNLKHCDECYCYVCDVPVRACTLWHLHNSATNLGPAAEHWKSQRQLVKNKKKFEGGSAPMAGFQKTPDDSHCRHCGRYNSSCMRDWCDYCGRIARTVSLGRDEPAPPQKQEQSDVVSLGTKTIPFRLHIADRRQMAYYQRNWGPVWWTARMGI